MLPVEGDFCHVVVNFSPTERICAFISEVSRFLNWIDVPSTRFFTVTLQESVFVELSLNVNLHFTTAFPTATAVITPLLLTVQTDFLEDDQTVETALEALFTVRVAVLPTTILSFVLLNADFKRTIRAWN